MVCIQGESKQIGGYGFMVEIDESKFVKRKYNKGRARVCEGWVLGGICRETGQVFMRIVHDRKKETLLAIIKEYVLPGTVILTDCWAAYKDLQDLDGLDCCHYTVNHSDTYVDPVTGAHTNTIEGTWAHCKHSTPKLSLCTAFLDRYLCRFIWFKLTKSLEIDPFMFLLKCISKQYKVNSELQHTQNTFFNNGHVNV